MKKYWQMGLNDAVFGGANNEYRYVLSRGLEQTHLNVVTYIILWVMINPSVATDVDNDHTIRKCIGFSTLCGATRMFVGNLAAYRSQDVKNLKKLSHLDLVGPDNNEYLYAAAKEADMVVCAWGRRDKLPKNLQARPESVLSIIHDAGKTPMCLGLTQSGDPWHPLMVGYDTKFQEYTG